MAVVLYDVSFGCLQSAKHSRETKHTQTDPQKDSEGIWELMNVGSKVFTQPQRKRFQKTEGLRECDGK